jgi:serine/threonine protein kinase
VLMAQLFSALAYLHDRGVCHRDLKLENLIADDDDLKLIDFGYSSRCSKSLTSVCGTPAYMAPELLGKGPYEGAQADMWAAGVILYYLLSGGLPFSGFDEKDLFSKIKAVRYKPLPV